MRQFVEDHEKELLLVLITMLAVTRWWIPHVRGFDNIYVASQWVLSYDHGLIRRGLIGTIVKLWAPIVTIEDVQRAAFIAYCVFLVFLLAGSYALLKHKERNGRLFRLILVFLVTPATVPLLARDLGRFDMFLTIIALLSMAIVSLGRHVWLIPILMVAAMFIHESFLILYAPTIVAATIFVYVWNRRETTILATLVGSVTALVTAFLILYFYGTPSLGYEEFSRVNQARAAFHITPLSMHECYFSIKNHYELASSSLFDAGSIANLLLALLVLSPVMLILLNLWSHALKNCGAHRGVCWLLVLATLSGLLVIPVATDYGRWLSAITFCNFFALFFLVSRGVVNVEELTEYTGGSFAVLSVLLILTYLLFGPLHDWNPYPYRDNLFVSSFSMISVMLFDVGFCLRWRSLREHIRS
ncbi:MAG TPA: hypothetical protein VI758_12575 [Bacteroidota bacterium]